jgi:polyhydroxybutyrate depolymerase
MRTHILSLALSFATASACGDADTDPSFPRDEPSATAGQRAATTPEPHSPAAPASRPATGASGNGSSSVAADARYDWVAGDYPPNLSAQTFLTLGGLPGQGTRQRGYKVHVPKGYDPKVPAPVLYAFHGFLQNAPMFVINGTGFVPKSDQEGFILVMPNGAQEDGLGGSWNAGVCCGAAAAQKLDDVGFVRAIHGELQKHLNIDAQRVYATGFSNGGFMTHRLGCEASDLFAAIAPIAASIGTSELGSTGTHRDPDLKACTPERPVAVLTVHGDADGIVPYAGMKPSLDHWARENGCRETSVPATQPMSGGDTTCVTYEGCAGVEVTGCTVRGGGHCWFGDASCGTGAPGIGNLFVGNNSSYLKTSDAVWSFVSRFRRAP